MLLGTAPVPEEQLERLSKVLSYKPILWVGAGLSVAAGYPSTWTLIQEMVKDSFDPIDGSQSFFKVADAYFKSVGKARLATLLQRLMKNHQEPTPTHHAIARLVGAGRFHAIVTTNYDPLIERALEGAGVPYLPQPLEDNAPISGEGEIRLLKIHGSYDNWLEVILTGRSYEQFGRHYPFLEKQLHVLLRQHPVLFTGCSLQDPRILGWIASLSEEEAENLHPWFVLLTQSGWEQARNYREEEGGVVVRDGAKALDKARIRPLLLGSHAELPILFGGLAARLPQVSSSLELQLHAGPVFRAALAGCPEWTPEDPFVTPAGISALDQLRALADKPLETDARGEFTPKSQGIFTQFLGLAERVGRQLTDAFLSPEARSRIQAAIQASTGKVPPLLRVCVHADDDSPEARRRADRLLALPWELLHLNGAFPLERGALDIAREAVVPGAKGLEPPDRELTIVATVAAPEDAVRLDYEEECYRL